MLLAQEQLGQYPRQAPQYRSSCGRSLGIPMGRGGSGIHCARAVRLGCFACPARSVRCDRLVGRYRARYSWVRVLPIPCTEAINEACLPQRLHSGHQRHWKRYGPKKDRLSYLGSGFVALQPRHLSGIHTLQRICHSICGLPRVAHVCRPLLTFAR